MMDVTVARDVLVRELTMARGVVDASASMPVLSNVLLEAKGGQVALTATDLDTFFRTRFAAGQVDTEGALTAPAARLLEYVRLLPEGDVRLAADESDWLRVTHGRCRARMAGLPALRFPDLPAPAGGAEGDADAGEPVAVLEFETLAAMLAEVDFAISTEESRFATGAAQFECQVKSGKALLRLVATDGHRLALTETSAVAADAAWKALVPRKAVRQLERLARVCSGPVKIYRGDRTVHFLTAEGREYATRELAGMFPDYTRVLPQRTAHTLDVSRGELAGVLGRVAQFTEEATRCVRVEVRSGADGAELVLRGVVGDVGESEESLPVAGAAAALISGFNAQYLMDYLKSGESEQVRFFYDDARSAGELRAVEDGAAPESRRYVVMPMRV